MTGLPITPRRDQPAPAVIVTRSAEWLTVTTETVPVRRAVLRIETTSEQVLVPVTVTRQHARVDYIDVDPAEALPIATEQLLDDAASSWLVLTADEPVVTIRPVPVERVRLVTSWVEGQEVIQATAAHEEITVEEITLQEITHDAVPAPPAGGGATA